MMIDSMVNIRDFELMVSDTEMSKAGKGPMNIEIHWALADELITRLREAERDAVRYRWLRDNCTTTQADCLVPIFVMTVRRKEHLFNVGLSIDQAMKENGDE